jgi:flagellin-like protein
MRKGKRGISPVITTVLLVLIAIVLAAIIILWARGFIKEKTMKFEEPIERSCEKIDIEASFSNSVVSIVNKADISIYRIDARVYSEGSAEIIKGTTENIYPGFSGELEFESALSGDNIEQLIPVLLGKKEKSEQTQEFSCLKQYWISITNLDEE